jgi:Ohr subfamily peroxiredoxin
VKVLYTAEATVTGGREEGRGRTSDSGLEVELRLPAALGGTGGGTNPEELFAIGYAACFDGAVKLVARRMKLEVDDLRIDSKVSLVPTDDRGFALTVALDVTLPAVDDPEQAAEIVRGAHQVCPYSQATRGNIDVALTVNGAPVD